MRVQYSQLGRLPIAGMFSLMFVFSPVTHASADLRPERVHVAEAKKTKSYVRDGLITGGDRAVDDVVIKDIRRATNSGFDRIVIDLEGVKNGEPAGIQRSPYYQIAVTPDERRLIFSIWGRPKLNFDSKKVLNSFKRSSVIQNVVLLPRLEDDSWTFVFELKTDTPVEVFELSNPVRVIMDVQHRKKN
jgi:hypothetical protein